MFVQQTLTAFETIISRKQLLRYSRLDITYFDLRNNVFEDRHFIRGVIKIQTCSFQTLSLSERKAVAMLVEEIPNSTTKEIA